MPRMQVKVSFSKKNSTFTCIISRSPTPYAGKIYVFKFKMKFYLVKTMVWEASTSQNWVWGRSAGEGWRELAGQAISLLRVVWLLKTIVFTREISTLNLKT